MEKDTLYAQMMATIQCSPNFVNYMSTMAIEIRQTIYDDKEFFTDDEGLSMASLTGGQ